MESKRENQMTFKKVLKLALVVLTSATLLTGCTQADTVRYNITQEPIKRQKDVKKSINVKTILKHLRS